MLNVLVHHHYFHLFILPFDHYNHHYIHYINILFQPYNDNISFILFNVDVDVYIDVVSDDPLVVVDIDDIDAIGVIVVYLAFDVVDIVWNVVDVVDDVAFGSFVYGGFGSFILSSSSYSIFISI